MRYITITASAVEAYRRLVRDPLGRIRDESEVRRIIANSVGGSDLSGQVFDLPIGEWFKGIFEFGHERDYFGDYKLAFVAERRNGGHRRGGRSVILTSLFPARKSA